MRLRKILSVILCTCLILTAIPLQGISAAEVNLAETEANVEIAETGGNIYGLVDNVQDGQILQCWNWSYQNIAANMSKIAQQGFSAIQTSPIQPIKETTKEYYNTVTGSSWVVYQPIAFTIETNSWNAQGTKDDFEYMCETAHKYGVKVIVDAVLNHMANDMSGNTIHPSIPSEIKNNSACWHDISTDISNYDNRYDVTQHCLIGLPDLNTANSIVQKHCTNFLKECIDAGADGFRFDAAKHIETDWDADGTKSDFWKNVLGDTTEYAQETRGITPYYYGEMLGSPGGGLSIEAYTQYMSVTDPGSSDTIRNGVCNADAAAAVTGSISNGASKSKTVQWVESHDNHKDHGTSGISEANINKAWAIVGAKDESCGMYLARPENMDTTMMGDADMTSWSYPEVKAVNNFKNYFVGQGEYLSSYNKLACVERGSTGIVIVNTGGTYYNDINVPVHTMESGTYTDAITGNTFTVSGGYIQGDIGDTGIAVVYDVENSGAFTKGNVTDVAIAGSFNDWDTTADKMIAVDGNTASVSMFLDAGTYTFKVATSTGMWFGNAGTIEDTTGSTGWTMKSSVEDNCTLVATGGKYTFKFNVSTGKLIVEHENTTDRTSAFYLKGTMNEWDSSAPFMYADDTNTVTTSIKLSAGTYNFKINNEGDDVWYSNAGTINDTTGDTGWTMRVGLSDKCTLVATGGTYTFSFNLSTQKLLVTTDATVETTVAEEETTVPETTTPIVTETEIYLKGAFNKWGTENPFVTTSDSEVVSVTMEIAAGTYGFKVHDVANSKWRSNTGTINDTTGTTGWTMSSTVSDKCTLVASGGTYTFNFNTSTCKLVVLYTPAETDPVETTYTVKFVDYDGTVISTQTVTEGSSATPPADPTREADAQYTYTFKEWSGNYTNVTADTTVTATYNQTVNKYTVTFVDWDGTELYTVQVEYGSAASVPPALPEREGYEFTGWDKAFDNITEDITVTAQYVDATVYLKGSFNDWENTNPMVRSESDTNVYTTTLGLSEGTHTLKIYHKEVWYGNTGTIVDTTTTSSSSGWLMEKGKSNCTLQASGGTYTFNYNVSTNKLIVLYVAPEYTVTFVDYDGTVLSTQSVAKGSAATAPADPTREADPQYTYTFSGWDKDFTNVTEDITVTALYDKVVNKYTVTFLDRDGNEISKVEAEYGTAATTPTAPTVDGYTFKGWSADVSNVTSDMTVTAVYSKNEVAAATGKLSVEVSGGSGFTISINGGAARPQGTSYYSTKTPMGASVTLVAKAAEGKEFLGWVNSNKVVLSTEETYTFTTTGNDFAQAVYRTDIEGASFVIFKNDKAAGGNGAILGMQYYIAGEEIEIPADPSQAGYDFAGWDLTTEEIAAKVKAGENVTVLATWTVAEVFVNVTVNGGTFEASNVNDDGKIYANYAVTATANAAEAGKKFAYWTDAEGNILSFSTEYKFYPSEDTEITAVYVEEDATIPYDVLVGMSADPNADTSKIRFYVSYYVPEEELGYEFVSAGVIIVDEANYKEDMFYHGSGLSGMTDTAPGSIQVATGNQPGAAVTKSNCFSGNTYYAKTWVIYKDAQGTEHTVYSDLLVVEKL